MQFETHDFIFDDEENRGALQVLAVALEERDPYTDDHCDRVARIARALGQRCDLDSDQLHHLALAARFHDVGKIGVRDDVLLHPGRLDELKMDAMRTHPERGQRLFLATGRSDATAVGRLIRHHHECFDGTGYPDGLQGSDIPMESRILTIADGFDAMTSARPYRDAMPYARAMQILNEEQGRLIDPDIFREFVKVATIEQLEEA